MDTRGEPIAVIKRQFMTEVGNQEAAKFAHWQKRSMAEQASVRDLAGHGIRLVQRQTLYAHPGLRLVKLTHIDDAGHYWFRSIQGNLRELPTGAMVVDTDLTRIPDDWTAPKPVDFVVAEDTGSDISEMDAHLGVTTLTQQVPDKPMIGPVGFAAVALLLLGILLLYL